VQINSRSGWLFGHHQDDVQERFIVVAATIATERLFA
jgi:hypothetical protein